MWVVYGIFFGLQVLMSYGKLTPLLEREEGEANIQKITWNCVSKQSATAKWKTISSNGYPKRLIVKDSRCSWKITAPKGNKVRLAFRGLDLQADNPSHCSANYIEIIDESLQKTQARFCGKNVPGDIVSKGSRLRIDFQAQSGVSKNKGFLISFKASKDKPGFYSKKSFDASKAPPTRRVIPKVYRIAPMDTEDSDSTDVGGIIGGVIAALLIVVLVFLYLRYRRNMKRKKKLRKMIENSSSTRTTDTEPGLPQNEVDPFERMSAVCEMPTKYLPLPGVELDATSSTYTNCKPPPLPRTPHPSFNKSRSNFQRQTSIAQESNAPSRHSFRSISTVATLPNRGVSTRGNLPRFNRNPSQGWIPIKPSSISTSTRTSQLRSRESRTMPRWSHRDTERCNSRPWKHDKQPTSYKIYYPEKPFLSPPLPPKEQLLSNSSDQEGNFGHSPNKVSRSRSRSISHLGNVDRRPKRSGRLRTSVRSNFSDVKHANSDRYRVDISKRDCLPRLQSTRSRGNNSYNPNTAFSSTVSGPRSRQGNSAT